MAYQLERIARGDIKRLLITLPPRHLKSHCVSVAFVAWLLGQDPTNKIIAASYGSDLAEDFSLRTRKVMLAPWYRRIFPGAALDPKRVTLNEIHTTRHGYRLATSVGGPLTGKGGGVILIDDPLKAGDAYSEAARAKVIEWFTSTLLSRLDNPKTDKIVMVAQRLHVDDLPGYVLEQGGWVHLNLPAIAVREEQLHLADDVVWTRRRGHILQPERVGKAELDQLRRELGTHYFDSQYQQEPVAPEGNVVKLEWFGRFDRPPPRHGFETIIQSWDTATEIGEANDYSVCTTWGINGDGVYLIDVFRDRLVYPDLRKAVIRLQQKFGAALVILEHAGSGASLLHDLRSQGITWINSLKPGTDKVSRLAHQSAKIEAGLVLLPDDTPWLEDFEDEIMAFPRGKHDDQVDSMSQFLRALDYRPPCLWKSALYKSDRWMWAQTEED
jgi:predicted phage terminase large subunit-like protein